jgi:hypothetical protein
MSIIKGTQQNDAIIHRFSNVAMNMLLSIYAEAKIRLIKGETPKNLRRRTIPIPAMNNSITVCQ